ncbi:MAG: PorT family protein [Bacteroidales bacterium]|nr:PorT family protein [Bacteroidales bacterium]
MKKVFAIAAALMLIGTTAFAQSFGAGYVQSTFKHGNASNVANGFYAGFGYTAEITTGLSLNPGIYYEFLTGAGNFTGFDVLQGAYQGKTTEHYVNVPLHLSYGINFAPSFKLFVYGGPTATIGIASNSKGATLDDSKSNYANEDYSRFDIMAGGGIGVELMNRVRLNFGYDFGLLDRDNGTNIAGKEIALKRNRLVAGAAFVF